jgi:hypothetical protein
MCVDHRHLLVMYILKIKEVDVMVNCAYCGFLNVVYVFFFFFLIVFSWGGGGTVVSLSSGNTHCGRIYS